MTYIILTHPGGAHKDDLLAVCVLIAEHGAPAVRRVPEPGDLEDPRVAVIDVGGSHDPVLSNFDHHPFERDHPPTRALSLVLDHLKLYRDALHLCEWLEPAEWFDSRGPNRRTAEYLGVRSCRQRLSSFARHAIAARSCTPAIASCRSRSVVLHRGRVACALRNGVRRRRSVDHREPTTRGAGTKGCHHARRHRALC